MKGPEADREWVRAWDRQSGYSITVRVNDWENRTEQSVLVQTADFPARWYVADPGKIDFRYFGEPPDAGPEVRREWARQAARERLRFWKWVQSQDDSVLSQVYDDTPPDVHGHRVAGNELARRSR